MRSKEKKLKKASKKHPLKLSVSKHSRRERNRAEDFVHKLNMQIARIFNVRGFKKLDRQGMFLKKGSIKEKLSKTGEQSFYEI